MPWTPSYNPGSSIGSQNHVTPPSGGNYQGFNVGFSGTYQVSGYSDAMYERVADDASGNHIWEFFITRRTNDSTWLAQNNTPNHAIRWTGTQWEDHDTTGSNTYPTSVTLNGTTVELYDGSNIIGTFTHPYTSGGGTGTEGSSYSGTLTVNGTSLEYEIPATSSSGTYELKADGITQLPIVHGSTASTGSAPNFDQTKIWTLISPMGDELDEIDLTGSGGSLTKKVFCNFW